ncbi:MAG: B12-binding domain-containing radical SAM protein [Candidatus Riflebacteria bacterium]|nr:B12-binding domain-containing radical SAM protein [Candidatus Riflebacteria bacterium]
MKIALIDPSFYHQGRLAKFSRIGYFPLTLARIAAYFPESCEVQLVYEKCQEIPFDGNFDLVFFTTMGSNIVRAEELSAEFRKRGAITIAGGYTVLPFMDRINPNFDAIVQGDAEDTIPFILEDAKKGPLKKFYESASPSIAKLPPPRIDLIPLEIVGNVIPLEISRGCPNACDFCAITALYTSKFRRRDENEVLIELEMLIKRFGKQRLIFFTDPNFTADLENAKSLLRKLIGKGVHWLASVDIRCLKDDEFLKLAKKSGCITLQIGLETLSLDELNGINKKFATKTNYGDLIKRAHSFGIPITALLMVGFDTDTPAKFRELVKFLITHKVSMSVIHPILPIPGTPLFRKWKSEGRTLPVDPREADGLHIHFIPKNFTPKELEEAYWQMNNQILSYRSIFRRFIGGHIFNNPRAFLIMFLTNIFARKVAAGRLPPGSYE